MLDLDDLTESITVPSKGRKRTSTDENDEEDNNDTQSNDANNEDEVEDDQDEANDEEMDANGDEEDDEAVEEDNNLNEEDEDDDDEDEESKAKKLQAAQAEAENAKFTYHPTRGEDIYGRVIDGAKSGQETAKYVPPARRNAVISMNPVSHHLYCFLYIIYPYLLYTLHGHYHRL